MLKKKTKAMNKYNIPAPENINSLRDRLSHRQANKLARFKDAFIAADRDNRAIVVLDEGKKPECTSMCVPALRLTVRDRGDVRHGPISWYVPTFNGKVGTHNKN